MKAVIVRYRVGATHIGNPRFQWKYWYDVLGLGKSLSGFDRLDSAVRMAKRNGATEIVKEWEII